MSWPAAASAPLAAGELHVWRVPLDEEPGGPTALDDQERARAQRFVYPRDRRRFECAHDRLRRILGGYLGCAPAAVTFRLGRRGKPEVDGLSFNLAHSHELALVAVARAGALGVDVERVRRDLDVETISRRQLAPVEREHLAALPDPTRAFFEVWARKEAYLKALGDGLAVPLDSFAVTAGAEAALLWSRDRPDDPSRYFLGALDPDPGYAAAVALDGPAPSLRFYSFKSPAANSPW